MPASLQPAMSATDAAGDLFLSGSYIELGIASYGNFGTTQGQTPAGYAQAGNQGVGLAFNEAGFGVNSAIPTIDFFTPGSPYEAFAAGYTANGATQTGFNYEDGSNEGVTATSLTDTSSGSTLSAEWVGVLDGNLRVTIDYSFGATDEYFATKVTLTNISGAAMDDVRYDRNVDPDNTEWFVGGAGFTTVNTVVAQQPGSGASEVTAASQTGDAYDTATGSTATILYYSTDPGTQVGFGDGEDPFSVTPGTVGQTETADDDIFIAYDGGPLAAGASTSFTYYTGLTDNVASVVASVSAPAAPGMPALEAADGPATATGLTDTATPVLTGTGTAGDTVTLLDGTATIGTGLVGADGTWSVTSTALADGAHTITAIQSTGSNATASAASDALAITVDTTLPAVSLGSANLLANTTTPVLSGTAEDGASVAVLLDGKVVGTVTADPTTGAWSYQVSTPLADGMHKVAAQATDLAGNVSAVSAASTLLVVPAPTATSNGVSTTDLSSLDFHEVTSQNFALQLVPGTQAVQLGDGTLSVGADTQQAFIARLYETALGRPEDTAGITGWNAQADAGASNATLAAGFLGAQEGQSALAGLSDTQFVDTLYSNALGRTADAVETDFWTGALSSGATRAQVLADIADSPEAKHALAGATSQVWVPDADAELVTFTYETAFDRTPETTGLQFWTQNLKAGMSVSDFFNDFITTPEFKAAFAGHDAGAVVDTLYQNGLGRGPTALESSTFAADLQNGTLTAANLLGMVATSHEATVHLATTL